MVMIAEYEIREYTPIQNKVVKQYEAIKKQGKCLVKVVSCEVGKAVMKFWRTRSGKRRSYWYLLPESTEIPVGEWVIPDEMWMELKKQSFEKSYYLSWTY